MIEEKGLAPTAADRIHDMLFFQAAQVGDICGCVHPTSMKVVR